MFAPSKRQIRVGCRRDLSCARQLPKKNRPPQGGPAQAVQQFLAMMPVRMPVVVAVMVVMSVMVMVVTMVAVMSMAPTVMVMVMVVAMAPSVMVTVAVVTVAYSLNHTLTRALGDGRNGRCICGHAA